MDNYVKDLAEAREAADYFESEARRYNNLATASRRLCQRIIENAALDDSLTQKKQQEVYLNGTIQSLEARLEQLQFQARIAEGRDRETQRNDELIGNMLKTPLTIR